MVADFSDIKRLVKGWIDRELDHKMILRHDDPLVAPLRALGEPMYLLESNPTVERIAQADLRQDARARLDVVDGPRLGDAELVRGVLGVEPPAPYRRICAPCLRFSTTFREVAGTFGAKVPSHRMTCASLGGYFLERQLVGQIEEKPVSALPPTHVIGTAAPRIDLLIADVPAAARAGRQRERVSRLVVRRHRPARRTAARSRASG